MARLMAKRPQPGMGGPPRGAGSIPMPQVPFQGGAIGSGEEEKDFTKVPEQGGGGDGGGMNMMGDLLKKVFKEDGPGGSYGEQTDAMVNSGMVPPDGMAPGGTAMAPGAPPPAMAAGAGGPMQGYAPAAAMGAGLDVAGAAVPAAASMAAPAAAGIGAGAGAAAGLAGAGAAGAGAAGTGMAAGILPLLAMFSDRRLKTNIRKIGELLNGLNVYVYDYISGGSGRGVMADEVRKVMPWAVSDDGGFDVVNYEMLGA